MKWTWTRKPFVWYWLKNWGGEKFVTRWCPGISQSNSGLSAAFDIQMHYGEAAAFLLTWSRTLRLLFISKSKIGSERTPFWVNGRHPEVCNAGHKRHPTSCVQECYKEWQHCWKRCVQAQGMYFEGDHIVADE